MASIILNIILLVNKYAEIVDREYTVPLAFVAVTLMWLNFIFWLRIFKKTIFYFNLIIQTTKGMGYFFGIFVLTIFACGNAMYILNANRVPGDDGDELYATSLTEGLGYLDAVLNQLIVAVGQGDLDNYSKEKYTRDRNLAWFVFVFVTIFV